MDHSEVEEVPLVPHLQYLIRCENGDRRALASLVDVYGADMHVDSNRRTLLMAAVSENLLITARDLLDSGASIVHGQHMTILASAKSVAMLELLVDKGHADVTVTSPSSGDTLLHCIVRRHPRTGADMLESVRFLLGRGAGIGALNRRGERPLDVFVSEWHPDRLIQGVYETMVDALTPLMPKNANG